MDINLAQILFQLVNFSVVVGALTYFLYNPVLKVFEERSKRVADGQKAAQRALETQDRLAKLEKKTAEEAKKVKADALKEARAEAKKQKKELLAEAKTEVQKEISQAREQWEKEKAQLETEHQRKIAEATITLAEKMVGETIDKKKAHALVDRELTAILNTL